MTRWQKEYRDIPKDSRYENTIPAPIINPLLDQGPYKELIGPHFQKELNLMLAGRKPVALLNHSDMPFWYKAIDENGWDVTYAIRNTGEHNKCIGEIIVSLPDQKWRASKLRSLILSDQEGSLRNNAKIGFLLGYTKECIAAELASIEMRQKRMVSYRAGRRDEFTDYRPNGHVFRISRRRVQRPLEPADQTVKLEVGKTYLNRRGQKDFIISCQTNDDGDLIYVSEYQGSNFSYYENGCVFKDRTSFDDLYKEV